MRATPRVDDVEGDPLRARERQRRRREARMEPADGQHEVRVVAATAMSMPISPSSVMKTSRDSNRAAKNQPRFLSNSMAPMKLTCSFRTAASSSGSTVLSTPRIATLPGNLDDDAEREADQRGRAPAELRHRADQEAVRVRREDRAQVADDARRVRDRVRREQDPVRPRRCARRARALQAPRCDSGRAGRRRRSA